MDKKEALIVLIKHSFVLTDEVKMKLLGNLKTLKEEEIDAIGSYLAEEKKMSLENNSQSTEQLDKIIQNMEKIKPQGQPTTSS